MIGKTINNYKITHFIGKGGMGSVYLAKHITLGKLMAVKLLNPHLYGDEEFKKRFVAEAKIQAHLDGSKGIVNIYDFVENNGQYFIFMEFIKGVSLKKYIKNNGVLTEGEAKEYFIKILKAMNEAHKKGVIHRDLKPSNIMITRDDSIKIMDFGIAKIIGEDYDLTKTGTKIGSSRYMSPEQVKGEDLDYRSDIYSLGLLLFEMLEGDSPYKTDTKSEYVIYDKILNYPLPKLQGKNKGSFMQKIIDRATEKQKEKRYQSINEFLQALEPDNVLIDDSPTQTSFQSTQKDNNLWLILGGGLLFVIALSIGGYFAYFNNADSSSKDQSKEVLSEPIQRIDSRDNNNESRFAKTLSKEERAKAAYEEYLKRNNNILNNN